MNVPRSDGRIVTCGVASSAPSSVVPLVHRDLRRVRRSHCPRPVPRGRRPRPRARGRAARRGRRSMRSASVRCTTTTARARVAELMPQVLALVRGVDRHRDRRRRAPRPTTTSSASGEFSMRFATRSPGRTPSSRSALASRLAVVFTSAAVNVTAAHVEVLAVGVVGKRRSSSEVIVCCSPLTQDCSVTRANLFCRHGGGSDDRPHSRGRHVRRASGIGSSRTSTHPRSQSTCLVGRASPLTP